MGDVKTDGRFVSKSMLKAKDIRVWTELTCFRPECGKSGNYTTGSAKGDR